MPGIGPKHWKENDRKRLSVKGLIPEPKQAVPQPDDVNRTYTNKFLHDLNWYEKRRPAPAVYVKAHEWLEDKEAGRGWSQVLNTLRLVQKKEARHSIIIPNRDDFWLLDRGDPNFVFLDNMRGGRNHAVYAVPRSYLDTMFEIGLRPAPIEDVE